MKTAVFFSMMQSIMAKFLKFLGLISILTLYDTEKTEFMRVLRKFLKLTGKIEEEVVPVI
jgi:hypothetical protein